MTLGEEMGYTDAQVLEVLRKADDALEARQRVIELEPPAVEFLAQSIGPAACGLALRGLGYSNYDIYHFAVRIINGELGA